MKSVAVDVLSDSPNQWVIVTPGRSFPSLVVQGDSFHSMVTDIESLTAGIADALGGAAELTVEAQSLATSVRERLVAYERVVQAAGLTLPYPEKG